jgi:DNA-binding helix-hairpin-helix protein with protein kinase domain
VRRASPSYNDELKRFLEASSATAGRLANVYLNLQPSFGAELAAHTRNAREAQRQAFLDSHQIADASIPGFGRDRKAKLLYLGIESAWDVRRAQLPSVPGIGEKLRDALESWAAAIERHFRFDAQKGVPEADRRALVARYRRQQQVLRAELAQLVPAARATIAAMLPAGAALLQRSALADERLGQTRADASLIARPSCRLLFGAVGIVVLLLVLIAAGRANH